ncbi:dual oxidase maturation factor 1-like [Tachyglossus aculeatus]|uniref:dual oxidase maturation factor 1-like n=1 Tax=Tachyglossus aculeatus TaxID=9261 RepID=UPI0018F52143|nr:dual oxidase maturation factor 1-like [Tachyglossus aculeatus]
MPAFGNTFPFYTGPKPVFPVDTTWAVTAAVFLTALVTFITILPGIRGKSRLFWLLRVVISLYIGAATLAVNFSAEWAVGRISANTTYKAFSTARVSVDVGLQVGLRGVNITLKGTPVHQLNETIDYNERFDWRFGKNYEEAYEAGLEKGLPDPVLYLAEKFSPPSPCGLHRQYRLAGHYASATLWMAFLCWLLANVLLCMPALVYGGHMLLATGLFLLLSLLFFSTATALTPPCLLRLGPATLQTHQGTAFWLTLFTGLLCLGLGLAVMVLNRTRPDRLKIFFNQSEVGRPEVGRPSPRYRPVLDIALSEALLEEDEPTASSSPSSSPGPAPSPGPSLAPGSSP